MRFEELVGQEFLFYGQDGYRFKLDDDIWEIIQQDDEIGYSSYKKTIKCHSYYRNGNFYREPVAIVSILIDNKDYSDGYRLQDSEFEHVWLRFGNDIHDRNLSLFYFEYTPMDKRPKQATRIRVQDHEVDSYEHLFNPREI